MNELVQMVSQKFNLSPEVAQQIVSFVFEQVKGRLPEGVSQHLEGFMADGAKSEGFLDSFKNMASSLVNKA